MQVGERVSIEFEGRIRPLKPVNTSMTLCKCFVLALGKNKKRTNISKEAAEDALQTLYNIPVVGHIYVDDDGDKLMGGHDRKVVKDEKGAYKFKKLTVPYGVVPYQNDVHYETVTESDGSQKEYLVCDVILWTGRYPELLETAYGEDVYFNQSMEIEPLQVSKMDGGYVDFKKYQYEALCLLGKRDDSKNVEPAFPSASVQPYFSESDVWDSLFKEFKKALEEGDGKEYSSKGEKSSMNENFLKILSEYGIEDAGTLPFELNDDITEEVLKEKLEAMKNPAPAEFDGGETGEASGEAVEGGEGGENSGEESNADTGAGEGEDTIDENDGDGNFSMPMTANEKREVLCQALANQSEEVGNTYTHYYLVDWTDEFVIYEKAVYDAGNGSCARKTFKASYEIGENGVSINLSAEEAVRLVWLTKEEEEKASKKDAEYIDLLNYKKDKEEEEKRRAYGAVVSEFSDLSSVSEYKELVSSMMEFSSVDDLKEKLYAIRGKTGIFKKKENDGDGKVHIPVNFSATDPEEESAERKFYKRYAPSAANK